MLPVVHVKILRKVEDIGGYITIVCENLESRISSDKYLMCTILPNWNELVKIKEGDTGYLKYKEVIAGKDTWYQKDSDKNTVYNWDAVYLDTFILDTPVPKKACLD